jgi:hypothetical protein
MEDGVKMDLKKIGWEYVDWIQLAYKSKQWYAVMQTVVNLQVL